MFLLSLIWNVCFCVHQPASGNWFLPNLIQTPLENYVKKCELSRRNLQTWWVFSIQSSLTQVDNFSSIRISFDILLIPFCHIVSWQISCNIFLPLKINGDAKPEGSQNELNVESIVLLVMFPDFRFSLKQSWSFSIFQCSPIMTIIHLLRRHCLHPLSCGFLEFSLY